MAQKEGEPEQAQLVACECVVLAETKDHTNWQLLSACCESAKGDEKKADPDAKGEKKGDDEKAAADAKGEKKADDKDKDKKDKKDKGDEKADEKKGG